MKMILAAFAVAWCTATSSFASEDLYVSTSPLVSCETATPIKGGPGYFEVNTFSFGGLRSMDIESGREREGKLSLGNFTIGKAFDNCSGFLMIAFLKGSIIPTLSLIDIKRSGTEGAAFKFLSITLTNAVIANYAVSGSSGGGTPPESISFSFEKACLSSTNQNADGSAAKTSTICYDAATNIADQN